MNKSTKIWLNSLAGAALTLILFYTLYLQVKDEFSVVDLSLVSQNRLFLLWGILLMPLNLALEIAKWWFLIGRVQPSSFGQAVYSYLAGIALSLLTPNRIGEYPARILYLRKKNTRSIIRMAILGGFSQFVAIFIFGLIGLIYAVQTALLPTILVYSAAAVFILFCSVFFQFEKWILFLRRFRWFRRLGVYDQMLRTVSWRVRIIAVFFSVFRYIVLILQYLALLKWAGVFLGLEGFWLGCLYFWSITVVPSVAFTELGVRGHLSLYIFGSHSENSPGIFMATAVLWLVNLVPAALVGSILAYRLKIWK